MSFSYEDILPISKVLSKYKKSYFLSYNVFIMNSSAIVNDDYVVHLNVKHTEMPDCLEHILTMPMSVDLDQVLHAKLENIHHEYMKHHGQLLHTNAKSTIYHTLEFLK